MRCCILTIALLLLAGAAWAAPGDITPTSKAFVNYSGPGGKAKPTVFNDTLKFAGNVTMDPATKTVNIPFTTSIPNVISPVLVPIPAGGTYTFPAITSSLWGRIIVANNDNNADFNMSSDGRVQILASDDSGLILSNSNLSGHLCIGSSVAANPVVLFNRTAVLLLVLITGFFK